MVFYWTRGSLRSTACPALGARGRRADPSHSRLAAPLSIHFNANCTKKERAAAEGEQMGGFVLFVVCEWGGGV